ncbi:type 2C protein phosphatase PTC1 [Aspergillus homomorphus CBS 101889]|uniref:PP2C-domain-containing protein n=1 Tax=Aspergillus homomorphus (strain CBS 101889) TaxID=1450537 RepID=A0A395I4A9_ASPHC|nr:PP2C-domain-containing protein [Aspergillus homomorphus CBS 101889]RAL14576.1 PP2C-domain-containing protein [Aspergillus homomorphus CBS 101889]
MFSGSSSPPKDRSDTTIARSGAIDTPPLSIRTEDSSVTPKKFSPPGGFFTRRTSEDQGPGNEKKRRSSTVTKAASFFTSAKNSLSLSSSPREHSSFNNYTIQEQPGLAKFGSMDPALSVPQGSLNNSAGESHPTARSSFKVGVTEDRNRKCRRTMEDTHAYLYNFLGTPALLAPGDTGSKAIAVPTKTSPSSAKSTSVVETDNGYFAIFDGHAGTFAAEWCGKKLHLILEDVMRKNPSTPVPELLDQTFTSVDQQLEKLPLKNSGCTAVIALLRWEDRVPSSHSATGSSALASAAAAAAAAAAAKADTDSDDAGDTPTQAAVSGALPKLQEKAARQRVLYTANVGDARIILCRNGKALRLSYDHKGSDENEGKRIANAGGLILNNRVNGVLAVTRALGDAYLKDLVTGHPYTTETVIQPESDEFIILACDGLWDVCSDQEAVDLIRNVPDAQEASKILVDHALARFSTDNLSCMVIRFDTDRVKEVVNRTAEPIGVEGDQDTEHGVSEADKIVEAARKSMAKAGLADNPEKAEKAQEEILEKMASEQPEPAPPAKDDSGAAIADKLKVPEPRNPTA